MLPMSAPATASFKKRPRLSLASVIIISCTSEPCPVTAKVFRSGNSRVLRLQRALKVTAKSYQVTPTETESIVTDPAAEKRRRKTLAQLLKLPPLAYNLPRP